jgi:hypothetical protein
MNPYEIIETIAKATVIIVLWGIIFGLTGLIFSRLFLEIAGKAVVIIAGLFGGLYLTVLALSNFGAIYSITDFFRFLIFMFVVSVAYLIVATSIRRWRLTWRLRDLKKEFLPQ